MNVSQSGALLVLVPVALQLATVAWLSWTFYTKAQDLRLTEQVGRTHFLISKVRSTANKAVILSMSGSTTDEQVKKLQTELESIVASAKSSLESLSNLADDRANLQENLDQAIMLSNSAMRLTQATVEKSKAISDSTISKDELNKIRKSRKAERQTMLVTLIETSDQSERLLEQQRDRRVEVPRELGNMSLLIFGSIIVIMIINIAATIILMRRFSSDIVNRLNLISDNAQRIASGMPLRNFDAGHDEIGKLDQSVRQAAESLTEIRRQELAVLDHAADVICSLDSRLRFVAVNEAATRVWKFNSDELLGMSLITLVGDAHAEATRGSLQKIQQGQKEGELENSVKTKNGEKRRFRWKVKWSEEEQRFSCVVHDVTELRAIEQLKQRFVLMVSHDLRSPLTAVSMSISAPLEGTRGPLSDKVERELEKSQTSLKRLMELINELLEIEKLESGTLALETTTVHAFNVCSRAAEELEGMASLAGVKIRVPLSDGLMIADESRLVQATINLLSNAVKFSPRGSTINFDIKTDGDFVEIRVIDEGPGIPPEDRAMIFERFAQSTSGSNVAIKGTGLGLAIVKAIVTAHGGDIGVDSTVGKGSTFWFKVPQAASSGNDAPAEGEEP